MLNDFFNYKEKVCENLSIGLWLSYIILFILIFAFTIKQQDKVLETKYKYPSFCTKVFENKNLKVSDFSPWIKNNGKDEFTIVNVSDYTYRYEEIGEICKDLNNEIGVYLSENNEEITSKYAIYYLTKINNHIIEIDDNLEKFLNENTERYFVEKREYDESYTSKILIYTVLFLIGIKLLFYGLYKVIGNKNIIYDKLSNGIQKITNILLFLFILEYVVNIYDKYLYQYFKNGKLDFIFDYFHISVIVIIIVIIFTYLSKFFSNENNEENKNID